MRLYGKRIRPPAHGGDFVDGGASPHEQWLTPWSRCGPTTRRSTRHRDAFGSRCAALSRTPGGTAYGFGLFVDNAFAGEINVNNVVRGAFQCGVVGYWIDQRHAGNRYIAEGVAVIGRFAFDELHLHRLEICIVPRNTNSRKVMEVLGIREEGIAQRYLEINGTWEDHMRYAITAEEWQARRDEFAAAWW